MVRTRIVVTGIVQGVGFRPFIYNLARELGLSGTVTNTSRGVIIEAEGEAASSFPRLIKEKHPPLARIESITVEELPLAGYTTFTIIESRDEGSFTHISPDVAVCDDCLRELLDPGNRRYQYPFINCTNCGPRYTITQRVPYDRPNTTMAPFAMCPQCRAEYDDPGDRRFHAQPNACPVCGPQVELRILSGPGRTEEVITARAGDPIGTAVRLLKEGAIVAVKGLGGFHLCCDAENRDAVALLRQRKRKSNKPFGLMAPDIETVRRYCMVSDGEARVMEDRRRPIVLLRKREDLSLPEALSPKNRYLGFMLPYTPLHHLLFRYRAPGSAGGPVHFNALVATSGNIAEEPIVIHNDEAIEKLSDLADAFLLHNRDIFMRVDDSVVRVHEGETMFVRRARGFAPEAIMLPDEGPEVLGCGAEIKNTFAITKGNAAIVSQHIGDMENLETLRFFEESLGNLKQVYRAEPVALAYDLHPGYLSTRWAEEELARSGARGLPVQHHYAHIASVMAEHGLKGPVIGVALDGTGYGTDGTIWGSEFLLCDCSGFRRLGHFMPLPLPGGDQAVREPWRIAVAWLGRLFEGKDLWSRLDDIGFTGRYGRKTIEMVLRIADNPRLAPLSAGAGRYFDAFAALLGLCDRATFEGEPAIALESIVPHIDKKQLSTDKKESSSKVTLFGPVYVYTIPTQKEGGGLVDFSPMLLQVVEDIRSQVEPGLIALRIHDTISKCVVDLAESIAASEGVETVALSGGCFQNAHLLQSVTTLLAAKGLSVRTNRAVPCNDACMSLGQAYLVRERLKTGDIPPPGE